MKVAVFGDIHGYWCDFRDAVMRIHEKTSLDLVLQCGDAQPFRNDTDLQYMDCPEKFRMLGDFWRFFLEEEEFPNHLLFIGGNHEPWNFLDEFPQGGELAYNIEFLGRSGMREINGHTIVGISGVYSPRHFEAQHLRPPYSPSRRKEVTYFNNTDVNRALGHENVDILLLHEWPSLVMDAVGRPSTSGGGAELSLVVDVLKPRWVFCGHMHHAARHRHGNTEIVCLSDFHHDPENSSIVVDIERGDNGGKHHGEETADS